jgi:hypothetical protein
MAYALFLGLTFGIEKPNRTIETVSAYEMKTG